MALPEIAEHFHLEGDVIKQNVEKDKEMSTKKQKRNVYKEATVNRLDKQPTRAKIERKITKPKIFREKCKKRKKVLFFAFHIHPIKN